MASLDRNLRRDLENAVKKARRIAEAGARQSLEQLAVHHHEPWGSLSPDQRKLRNRLRAHGRQLGDKRDEKKGTQSIERLVGECAYEHWHRLLFARFLAENELLVEPDSGMPLSLDECRELARDQNVDWLELASDFAQRMLPQIFRAGDPVLEVTLPPEARQELEGILETQPAAVFTATDSLGWVYQFWQSDKKKAVNKSERKIGADELPPVTQLFTEDYMVRFLLDNTLGAWWAAKVLAQNPSLAETAGSEADLRKACGLLGLDWQYLRFVRDEGSWRTMASCPGTWPDTAREIRVLDPFAGSGHFLVFAFPVLVALRRHEEGLSLEEACDAVLRDNLFGLEIDPRCTQLAAFGVALAAWRMAGYRPLPPLQVACSGLSPNAKEDDWLRLAGDNEKRRAGMRQLYEEFQNGPVLGSLINPSSARASLLTAGFEELHPLLEAALREERESPELHELAVTARGIAGATTLLTSRFTLIVTNVPYLTGKRFGQVLREFCERQFEDAWYDLSTASIARCLQLLAEGGTFAAVVPQNWLLLGSYKNWRERMLDQTSVDAIVLLGEDAWQTFGKRGPQAVLCTISKSQPDDAHVFHGMDLAGAGGIDAKTHGLLHDTLAVVAQSSQAKNPDARITLSDGVSAGLLRDVAISRRGIVTGDTDRYVRKFWELSSLGNGWRKLQSAPRPGGGVSGCDAAIDWRRGGAGMLRPGLDNPAYGCRGVAVAQLRTLAPAPYTGELYDNNTGVVVPRDPGDLGAVASFVASEEFRTRVRELDAKKNVTNATLIKVAFDIERWRRVASTADMSWVSSPSTEAPNQWLFRGGITSAEAPLQVAVAHLLGYSWPSASVPADSLERDEDGIVCIPSLKGEASAQDRLGRLLATAFHNAWSPAVMSRLLVRPGRALGSLEEWLRDVFFEEHLSLFQDRPFVWHVWDGLSNGFGALVNYHRLAAPNGEGRRTLEKLIYSYLGDWIDRQRADLAAGAEGADARVAAAEHLKCALEQILDGEPPYDIFVRWKPLHHQAIGWEPDLNDGIRANIRPFIMASPLNARGSKSSILRITPGTHWKKDRGKESRGAKEDYPWFWGWDGQTEDFMGGPKFDGNRWNDLHYTRAAKLAARERAKAGGKS